MSVLTIGLTHARDLQRMENYVRWLTSSEIDVQVVDLNNTPELPGMVPTLDAVVLAGGGDLDPRLYGKPDEAERCEGIDSERDRLEAVVFSAATEACVPVLGICRGLQAINVFSGGTLHAHLPDVVDGSGIHQKEQGADREHEITVEPGSLLYKGVLQTSGTVNSAHHQGIDVLADGFVASAWSTDSIIEAVERIDPSGKGYVLGVQWHPERMQDRQNSFSKGLLYQFLFEAMCNRALRPPL